MTSTISPPEPVRAGRTTRPLSRPLVAGGALLLSLGIVAGTAAGGVMVAFGPDQAIDSGYQPVSTSTAALVSDVAAVGDVADLGVLTATPVLEVSVAAEGPTPVFVAVGPAEDVAEYLDGVAIDEVSDLEVDPFRLDVRHRDGGPSAAAPAEGAFWSASATSSAPAEFSWPIEDGNHRIVVMNADGSLGVAGVVRLQVRLPEVFSRSLGLLIGSGMVGVIGVGLMAMAWARSGRTI